MPQFSTTSKAILATCHPDLQRLFNEVILQADCTPLEGLRTEDQQAEYVRTGKSKTMQSKHLRQPDGWAHALDIVPYPVDWEDTARMAAFAGYVLGIAAKLEISLRWGNAWDYPANGNLIQAVDATTFRDYPHFELV